MCEYEFIALENVVTKNM